jgi:phage shock protein E
MRWLLLLCLSAGCAADTSSASARDLVARGALLVDVRSREEVRDRPVAGAVNVPIDELSGRLSELPRDRPVVVFCHSGARAGAATLILRKAGFRRVHNAGSVGRLIHGSNDAPPLF